MARRNAGRKRAATFAKHLVIMAKSPRLGRVKRRLSREIGEAATIRFYRSCLSHSLLRLGSDPRWRTVLAIAPDRDVGTSLPSVRVRIARLGQGEGDLGQRMQRLFAALPPGPAIIVGSDIPALRPAHVAQAFRLLGGADAVLGPAQDGGFWLIGLKRSLRVPRPFAGVRWSSTHALADTLANLEGRRIAFAATLSDVDTPQTYGAQNVLAGRLVKTMP